jgi:hypothetical protein
MATIKTQLVGSELRIITKSGLISCSCCDVAPAECCMYPAQGLIDGDYLAADLPDSVLVSGAGGGSGTYTKNGSIYERLNVTLEAVIFPAGTNARWAFFLDGDEVGDRSAPCLITTEFTQQVTDFFEDTYEVSDFDGIGFTVERQSLCRWYGEYELPFPNEGFFNTCTLFYGGLLASENSFELSRKWVILYNYFGAGGSYYTKISPQNTPVGTYEDPPFFSGSPTVSAP